MATREITKRHPHYAEPELDQELIVIPEDESGEGGRLVDKARLLWERRTLLYRWAIIGLVASTIIALLIPPLYTTTARLMPPDQAGQGIASMVAAFGKASDLGALGSELFGVKTSGDLFVGVLKSDIVENAIIKKFDLRKVYGNRRWEDARKRLENNTDVSADRKSGIITIKVTDRSPQRAADIGREYVEQLNHVVITLDTSAAHRERIFLESRLKEVQVDLESAEKDFGQFASKNATLDVKEQGKAMISAAGELEGQLIAAQTELEGLRQIYTDNNVRVRSTQARIGEYKRQLEKLGGQSGALADDNSAAGAAGGKSTSGASSGSDELYPSIRKLPILGVEWADLYRRTRVQEAVFETLTKQYEVARVDEAREVPSVKVLDPADVPERKSFPPRTLIVLFGTMFTVMIAAAWVVASAGWEKVDAGDARKVLALEIYETVRSKPWVAKAVQFVRSNLPFRRPSGEKESAERSHAADEDRDKE